MSANVPVDLLFGGMRKLGPGDDAQTLIVLNQLPTRRFDVVVDAGCGTGRQTLALAQALGKPIHAVDSHEPFLRELSRRAAAAGLANLVQTHCIDMKEVARVCPRIDLLWSEGAAYNIGFGNALTTWARSIREGGFAVVSELSWVRDQIPAGVREYFQSAYPAMQPIQQNVTVAAAAGYEVLATHTLPRAAWVDGYYDVLEPRARALLDHQDAGVRAFAVETLEEIGIFEISEDSYGYVFYILRRT